MFLASAEIAAVSAILGHIPDMDEYLEFANGINTMAADVYRYLNFNEIESFQKAAAEAHIRLKEVPVASS